MKVFFLANECNDFILKQITLTKKENEIIQKVFIKSLRKESSRPNPALKG